jgi:tRNA (uracil-5-)-methyltransferase TRM9
VKESNRARLLALNARFYREFAASFSATRQRLQPGVEHLLPTLQPAGRLLDLGCGNGELARRLVQGGFSGMYMGIDFSLELLAFTPLPRGGEMSFHLADLSSPTWDTLLPAAPFDAILAFAVLHHLPGEDTRLRLLQQIRTHLALNGQFIFSVWQFQNSPRLAGHRLPWETVGLSASDVDEGDTLLDWRQGGRGIRYMHQFSEAELARLAQSSGFTLQNSFYSDGRSGDLALYQVWSPQN